MLSFFRNNFGYKMLALFFAISLHYYASALDTHSESKVITVPLTVNSIPAGAIFDPQTAPNISVTVSGVSDVIDRLSGTNVTAAANLSSCKIGNNPDVRVEVRCADITNGNATLQEVSPATIPIILTPMVRRAIVLEAPEPGVPPAGYAYKTPVIAPLTADVVGDKTSVGSVSQLVVKTETSESSSTVDGQYQIVPLDSSGQEVTTVSVVPQQAHVKIGIMKVPAMKALIVSPTIVNSPPFPYRIASVQVKPESLMVSGRPERLNQVSTLSTAAIDVSGAVADIQRQVQPVAPNGTSLSDSSPVTVTIHIVTEQPDESVAPSHAVAPQTTH
jgi:YbbR domain-containing protein